MQLRLISAAALLSNSEAGSVDTTQANVETPIVATTETAATEQPVKAKRARKPAAKQSAKAASKPQAAKPAQPADKRAERVAIVGECLALAGQHYHGASPSFHRSARPCKRADYVARVLSPVQTAKSPSERDESHLATIVTRAKRDATFDPAALCCDLGVISRLASLALIEFDDASDTFSLTTAGAKLGRNVAKRLIAAGA